MEVEVGSRIKITNPSPEIVKYCKDNLVLNNPEYQKKVRMSLWTGNTPRQIYLYEIEGQSVIIPFGCLRSILPFIQNAHVTKLFSDCKRYNYNCEVPLYDYQNEALKALTESHYGILQSPAGSGKTQIGIALAADLGVRTLWLTHTKDLLNQSKSRAEQYILTDKLGAISEGKVEIGELMTFATIQTMCRLDLEKYRDTWDCIIVDECHRVSGTPTAVTQFSKVLNTLKARHKYGLSATVHRSDGLIQATYSMLGGFNNKHYDNFILKAVMCGFTPEEVKEVNDAIILYELEGWNIPSLREYRVYFDSFDLRDDCQDGISLKAIEAHLGIPIEETGVEFDIDRKLTDREIEITKQYCMYDVDATEQLFNLRQGYLKNKITLGASRGMTERESMYMTNAKLTSVYLKAKKPDEAWTDERQYKYPDKLLKQYIPQEVFDFFNKMYDSSLSNYEVFSSALEIMVGECKVKLLLL